MGNEVFICGRVGHDTLGNDLEAVLIHEGIKTDFLSQDRDAGTGTVTLAVDERAKYSTIVHEAANVRITKESVDAVFHDVDAGRLRLDCVYLTLESQREMVDYVIREAAKRDLFIFCDAAPHVRPLDTALLPLVSIVAPNQLEALAITGVEVKDEHGAEKAAEWLLDHGAQQVLITIGEQGALYQKAYDRKFERALSVKAIDEAGAGDAFRATFLHYLLRRDSIEDAMSHAAAAGAYAVTHFGSYSSMPSESQLEDFMRQLAHSSHEAGAKK
jgi:ribokinase